MDTMYRYVWFYMQGQEKLLLAKSSLWYVNREHCLEQGKKYPLSIDLPAHKDYQVLLEVEHCILNPAGCITTVSGLRLIPEQLLLCSSFNADGEVVFQLPYHIESSLGNKMYVYTIRDKDIWFYSAHDSLQEAYLDYLHS